MTFSHPPLTPLNNPYTNSSNISLTASLPTSLALFIAPLLTPSLAPLITPVLQLLKSSLDLFPGHKPHKLRCLFWKYQKRAMSTPRHLRMHNFHSSLLKPLNKPELPFPRHSIILTAQQITQRHALHRCDLVRDGAGRDSVGLGLEFPDGFESFVVFEIVV